MKEHAVTFGMDNSLVGIYSDPENTGTSNKPAVLLLNANVLHRIGPFRMYVRVARHLNNLGYPVLRFDLSGIGDSPARKSNLAYDDRTVSEVKEAMDYLAKEKNVNQFILMGLCAGADSAYRTAVTDRRVIGMVLLDGYGYRTIQYYLRHYVPRLFSPGVWIRLVKRQLQKLQAIGKEKPEDMSEFYTGVRNFPPQKEMEQHLQQFVSNNVRLLCVFTGGLRYFYYNYKNQFQDMFKSVKFGDAIEVVYYPQAEHTYIDISDRELLIDTVSAWITKHFG